MSGLKQVQRISSFSDVFTLHKYTRFSSTEDVVTIYLLTLFLIYHFCCKNSRIMSRGYGNRALGSSNQDYGSTLRMTRSAIDDTSTKYRDRIGSDGYFISIWTGQNKKHRKRFHKSSEVSERSYGGLERFDALSSSLATIRTNDVSRGPTPTRVYSSSNALADYGRNIRRFPSSDSGWQFLHDKVFIQ